MIERALRRMIMIQVTVPEAQQRLPDLLGAKQLKEEIARYEACQPARG
jgi:hypothetical protein